MPDPETSWLDEAEDVTDAPEWTSEALEVKETVPKEISAAERARSGLPVFGGERDPSAPREELTEDFVARDRVEGGRARGRVLMLAPTDISVDPRTGDSAISVPDASEAREAVLYEPSEDVIARTPGISRARDDSVSLRGGARFEGLPGLASALQYAEGLVPDARYSPGAMATGASEMLTLGHTDEIAEGIRGAQGPGTYEEERDRARAEMAERAAEQPGSTLMGMGAGLGLMALVPGAREAAAARGGGAAARIGAAVGEGTVLGAAAGSGASEAELGSPEHLRDTSTGGVIGGAAGGALQGAGEVVGAGVRRMAGDPQALREGAALRRIRGIFGDDPPSTRQLSQVVRGEQSRAPEAYARLRAAGVRSLDDAEPARERVGAQLDDIATRLDETAAARPRPTRATTETPAADDEFVGPASGQSGPVEHWRGQRTAGTGGGPYREPNEAVEAAPGVLDASEVAAGMRAYAEEVRRSNAAPSTVRAILEKAAQWEERATEGPMTFRRAWELTQRLRDPRQWSVDAGGRLPVSGEEMRTVYMMARRALLSSAEAIDPRLAREFADASHTYALVRPFSDAANASGFAAARNRQLSLTDTMGAMAGAATGGPGGAIVGAGANRMQRLYEHRVVGSAMDRLARIVERQPGQLGPYGTMLQNAANRGPGTFSAAWYLLARQHPELQQRVQDIDDPDSAPSGAGEY